MRLDSKRETTPNVVVGSGSEKNAEMSENFKWRGKQTPTSPSNPGDDHYTPTVRRLKIPKTGSGACGFRLTRSKWDPYPWVLAVDVATPANVCGLKAGDCVLEVNGKDVLGLRIKEIAELVKAKSENITLLLWSSGCDAKCDPESLCCGPMPRSLQRLSAIVQSILSIIECPVCLDTISPPAMQCQNGHLLCVNCRIRAEKCPVCRERYTPRRALIAEQIYNAITSAFNLCRREDRLRQKLFGGADASGQRGSMQVVGNTRQQQQRDVLQQHYQTCACVGVNNAKSNGEVAEVAEVGGSAASGRNQAYALPCRANKYLTKWWHNKQQPPTTNGVLATTTTSARQLSKAPSAQLGTSSNQFQQRTSVQNHLTATTDDKAIEVPTITPAITTMLATTSSGNRRIADTGKPTNNGAQVNGMSKHFSLSTNDLSQQQDAQEQQQQHSSPTLHAPLMAIKRATNFTAAFEGTLPSTPASSASSTPTASASCSLLSLDTRRPSGSLNSSIECMLLPEAHNDDNAVHAATMLVHSSTSASSRHTFSSSSSSCSTSSGVFTSMDSFCSATALKDDLLRLSPSFNVAAVAAPPTVALEQLPASQLTSFPHSSTPAATTSMVELGPAGTPAPVDSAILSAATLAPTSALCASASAAVQSQPATLSPAHAEGRYRCPCDCDARFYGSTQLQQHVKLKHRLPVLSWSGATAQLVLPLRQPVDNAVLILELNNAGAADACQAASVDEHAKSDDMAERSDKATKDTKECWIRIKRQGEDCIQAAALLLATAAESADFVMETRLSGRKVSERQAWPRGSSATNKNVGECKKGATAGKVQRTRSIVHSMETTTWRQAFERHESNNNHSKNSNNNSKENTSSSSSTCSDLHVISVIFQDILQRPEQQQQLTDNSSSNINSNGAEDDVHYGDLLLHIDVRLLN